MRESAIRRSHRFIMMATLLWAALPAFAQDRPGAQSVAVQGILISPNGRSALIGGQLAREGEGVLGARVAKISESSVVLHSGNQALTVPVGGSASWANAVPIPSPAKLVPPSANRSGAVEPPETGPQYVRTVAPGDTLSEIAAKHLAPGMTLEDMMQGIFRANPHAFGDSVHHLIAGTALRLPTAIERRPLGLTDAIVADAPPPPDTGPPRDAAPAISDRTASPPAVPAEPAHEHQRYGPVQPGETLSEIAFRIAQSNFTADQVMVAIYELNPDAFSNNINLLKAGAVLRLPAAGQLSRVSPDYAAGEVRRQTDEWRNGRMPILAQAHSLDHLT